MAKKPKTPTTPPPDDPIDVAIIERGNFADDDPPPHDEVPDDYYADDGAEPDVDYLPEESDGREEEGGDEGDGDSLLSPAQLRSLRESAEKMRRPLSYMKADDHGTKYLINEVDVSNTKALAIPDWIIVQRSLWVKGKSVESHGHRLIELKGKPAPRPNTFTNREKWKDYHNKGKDSDPWGNIQTILPLQTASGGIIAFQASTAATKAVIGDLLAAFAADGGKRRPIIEFTNEVNPETGESFPVLRIIGWAENNSEKFGFLRDMLIKDDPEYPEPKETTWTGFGE